MSDYECCASGRCEVCSPAFYQTPPPPPPKPKPAAIKRLRGSDTEKETP